MKKILNFVALLIAAPLVAHVAHFGVANSQTAQQYTVVPSIAALKAMTNRPPVVQVVDANPGIFNLSQGACSAADDIYQVQPTSGSTVCYMRMSSVYAMGPGGVTSVNTTAALKALTTRPAAVNLLGCAAPNDGCGGLLYWVAGSSATADDHMVWQPTSGAAGRYIRLWSTQLQIKWFGAKGDNVTDDTAAVSAALTYANALNFPVALYFNPGYYQLTGALTTITNSTRLVGDGPRSAILTFSGGSYDAITFKSTTPGVRVADGGIAHLGLYASGVSGGNLIVVDYAQATQFNDLLVDGPYNFMSIRQAGNTRLSNIQASNIRGAYGIKAYGDGTTRNSQTDKIDVIELRSMSLQGSLTIGTVSSTDLLWLDGYVQTVDIVNTSLLTAGRAIRTTNSPGVANPLWPSFLTATNLQVESPYIEAFRLEYLNTANFTNLWVSGAVTGQGIYMGPNVREVSMQGRVHHNYYEGIQIDGSSDITVAGTWVYANSQVGSNLKSGIFLGPASVTNFTMAGGLAGKATGTPAYTENQKYGIDVAAQTNSRLLGVDTAGNATGGVFGTIPQAAMDDSPTFTGTVRANTGFSANGAAGLSATKTVRDSAGTGTCTLIFTFGLLTGGTC